MSEELDIIEQDNPRVAGYTAEAIENAPVPVNLFGAHNPEEVVARAAETATALAKVIEQRKLFQKIGNKPHVLVEGWTLLGSMMGVFPVVTWTRKLDNPEGWEARVEVKTLNGQVVGAAEAECLRAEKQWASRDDYALRSMAQTRATSKALRGPLGFIVHLAGFNATPAEEIVDVSPADPVAEPITNKRHGEIAMKIKALDEGGYPLPEGVDDWTAWSRRIALQKWGKRSRKELTEQEGKELARLLQAELDNIPFG